MFRCLIAVDIKTNQMPSSCLDAQLSLPPLLLVKCVLLYFLAHRMPQIKEVPVSVVHTTIIYHYYAYLYLEEVSTFSDKYEVM